MVNENSIVIPIATVTRVGQENVKEGYQGTDLSLASFCTEVTKETRLKRLSR